MEIGILGLPQSGKSSLFEIMTGIRSRDLHGETCVRGQAVVPDPRFDRLVALYKPERIIPAKLPFVDVHLTGEKKWEALRQAFMGVDGLIHVVDGFTALEVSEAVNRWRRLTDELILADLQIVENRLEKLEKIGRRVITPAEATQRQLLLMIREKLEEGMVIRDMGLSGEEEFSLRGFGFWTIKPELTVINVSEDGFSYVHPFQEAIARPVIGICCPLEAELGSLPPEEQREYLAAVGYEEPAFVRIIKGAFAQLGKITFFTVGAGAEEVRAWVITKGTKAPQAAGVIHQDFERGFIKAEVVSYEDFIALGATMPRARAAGKIRLEGKGYIVQDGDIITFRFNV